MPRTRIKICGITTLDAARCAADAGADAIGFVFVEDSPRAIDPDDAFDIMHALPPFLASVGVTRDLDADEFADIEEVCPTLYSQLHGDEPERVVRACGPDVIKAVKVDPTNPGAIAADFQRWAGIEEVCAILVDAPNPGAGTPFDWKLLKPFMDLVTTPIILAGGLTPENVGQAIAMLRPWGVDVSSGVESERGVKDLAKIEAFCKAARRADA
jgi:phosphoribosylanthranilate isomerase